MPRRPHPRLAAAQARAAERMREAAAQLETDPGPIEPKARVGLVRLLNAVADRGSSSSTGVSVWDATANIADILLKEPLGKAIGRTRGADQGYWYG